MQYVIGAIVVIILIILAIYAIAYALAALIASLPALILSIGTVFILQWALRRWYIRRSAALRAESSFSDSSFYTTAVIVSISLGSVAVIVSLLAFFFTGKPENTEDIALFVLICLITPIIFTIGSGRVTRRFKRKLEAELGEIAAIRASIEKEKAEIIEMIEKATKGKGGDRS